MLVQVVCAAESLATVRAWEGLLSVVESNMLVSVSQLAEFLAAVRTGEGFLSYMN